MADLLDELRADSRRPGPRCLVCIWLDEQPNSEIWRQAFAADNDEITSAALHRRMKRDGWRGTAGTVERHRRLHVAT